MPVIDEIDERARRDRRVRFFDQSDLGLYVRMAVLAQALELEIVEP
jgi:aspartate carbamoyltransferase catalytic subunit